MDRRFRCGIALGGALPLAVLLGCATHDLTADPPGGGLRERPPAVARISPRSIPATPVPQQPEWIIARREAAPRFDRSVRPATGTQPPADESSNLTATLDPSAVSRAEHTDAPVSALPVPPQPIEPPGAGDSEVGSAPRPPAVPADPIQGQPRHVAPIDFGTALSLTAGKNPQVALARERVDESLAQLLAAESLWLPSIRVGANYNKHDGRIQDVAGKVFETSRVGTYGGLGARGVGAGSPTIPGVYVRFDLGDAVFGAAAADRRAQSLDRTARATLNDELLESAIAYLDLLDALQAQAIADETVANSQELAQLTSEFARAGQGTEADADRAATSLAIQRNRRTGIDATVAAASARLAQQLRLDPTVLLTPVEPNVAPVCLIEVDRPVGELVASGLSRRPELAANRLLVDEAVQCLRREKYAVLLPSVLVGMEYGAMGGGFNNQIVNSGERFDFDAVAWWEVRNLGFGEKAARDQAQSRVDQARLRTLDTMDTIAREIVQFHAQVEAARAQLDVARDAVESARAAHRRDLARIREGEGLPIEALQSLLALDAAQRDYLRATIEHNKAQFQLQRALGWPVK